MLNPGQPCSGMSARGIRGEMMAALEAESTTGLYRDVDDAVRLRIAVEELNRIPPLLQDASAFAAELPDVPLDRAAGIHVASTIVDVLIKQAQNRLNQLTALRPPRRPVVVDPTVASSPAEGPHGLPYTPVLTAPSVATEQLSSAEAWLAPGQHTAPHEHPYDVWVLVRSGLVITVWWDEQGRRRQLLQTPGQHLLLPAGVPHCVYCPGPQPAFATQVRATATFTTGVVLREDLAFEVAGIELPVVGRAS
jgi:uncharacterized RmlC-like cupin family protein